MIQWIGLPIYLQQMNNNRIPPPKLSQLLNYKRKKLSLFILPTRIRNSHHRPSTNPPKWLHLQDLIFRAVHPWASLWCKGNSWDRWCLISTRCHPYQTTTTVERVQDTIVSTILLLLWPNSIINKYFSIICTVEDNILTLPWFHHSHRWIWVSQLLLPVLTYRTLSNRTFSQRCPTCKTKRMRNFKERPKRGTKESYLKKGELLCKRPSDRLSNNSVSLLKAHHSWPGTKLTDKANLTSIGTSNSNNNNSLCLCLRNLWFHKRCNNSQWWVASINSHRHLLTWEQLGLTRSIFNLLTQFRTQLPLLLSKYLWSQVSSNKKHLIGEVISLLSLLLRLPSQLHLREDPLGVLKGMGKGTRGLR